MRLNINDRAFKDWSSLKNITVQGAEAKQTGNDSERKALKQIIGIVGSKRYFHEANHVLAGPFNFYDNLIDDSLSKPEHS